MNKFEQVFSDGHQISLERGSRDGGGGVHVPYLEGGQGVPYPLEWVRGPHIPCLKGEHIEVQCIIGDGHMGPPTVNRMTDRHD